MYLKVSLWCNRGYVFAAAQSTLSCSRRHALVQLEDCGTKWPQNLGMCARYIQTVHCSSCFDACKALIHIEIVVTVIEKIIVISIKTVIVIIIAIVVTIAFTIAIAIVIIIIGTVRICIRSSCRPPDVPSNISCTSP